jgi:DNA-binding transcriptional LysR family regulator
MAKSREPRNSSLRGLDISLFAVFDAVMTERNVTRAARRLNMSQPAVSSALKKLRYLLDDRLFRRVPGGVHPTQRAQELSVPVQYFLAQMRTILEPNEFSPATEFRRFTLAISEHCSSLLLPILSKSLEDLAPNIQLVVVPKRAVDVPLQLESGEIDMAIGLFRDCPARVRQQTLFTDQYVCVTRKRHPLSGHMGAQGFTQAHHLRVSPWGSPPQELDLALQYKGIGRHVALTINHLALAPGILKRTDLILTTYRSLVEHSNLFRGLEVHELPIELAPLQIRLVWHAVEEKSPGAAWLRAQITTISRSFQAASK